MNCSSRPHLSSSPSISPSFAGRYRNALPLLRGTIVFGGFVLLDFDVFFGHGGADLLVFGGLRLFDRNEFGFRILQLLLILLYRSAASSRRAVIEGTS